ncbi:hypothetical protein BEWA_043540 [Theileria equi strain WA]|uniref:Uncharacterized protein n=1 Tax=Theileria equi strain WA TaxID=1537102 RepID=L1LGS1_THEEQ|nr:hypothetical protein BEWA_043540 [Theileria equi strain WA]EKX74313.1 hypothetical protein BEWA_043540 [Theileria equi strain WA]|eukprot:XP_004833765.1 hypothetical protein BEWA_043540 [Theileria equi strain WA]
MGGFYNLASVVHIKSAELVEAIKSPSMEFDKKSVLSYMGLFKLFEEDLMVPLIRIMDTSAYNAFLKLSTNYIQATVQLNKTYGYTELVKYDNALADFNTAGSEMSKSLALELPPTCRHGVISTNTFFKSAATKYKEI